MHKSTFVNTDSLRQSLARGSILTKSLWFILGMGASYVLYVPFSYIQNRPKDLTQELPASIQQLAPGWMSRAKTQSMGRFVFVGPDDASEATAFLYPVHGTGYPLVYFLDENGNGSVDNITIIDANYRSISASVENTDGVFNSYVYSTDLLEDSMSFLDADMNGEYDHRFGPGREFAVLIESKWYDVIIEGTERYVEIGGELTQIEQVGNVWRVVE